MTARPRINVMLRSEQSSGAVAAMDNRVRAGAEGPPLHLHDFDEAFYVIEGELTFQLDDTLVTRRAGEVAFARRGVPHAFANQSSADARMLLVCTPGGFERHFDGIAAREAGVKPPPEVAKGWPEVTKVGPRIGDRPPDTGPDTGASPDAGGSLPAAPDRRVGSTFATRTLVRSEESGDALALVENTVPAGWEGTPLHHHAFDEAFYVLDGELTFQVGDERVVRRAGELAFAPRDVHHAIANPSDGPARYLLVCTPGGFERYFDELGAKIAGVAPPPQVAKGYPETIVVGPPIGG